MAHSPSSCGRLMPQLEAPFKVLSRRGLFVTAGPAQALITSKTGRRLPPGLQHTHRLASRTISALLRLVFSEAEAGHPQRVYLFCRASGAPFLPQTAWVARTSACSAGADMASSRVLGLQDRKRTGLPGGHRAGGPKHVVFVVVLRISSNLAECLAQCPKNVSSAFTWGWH